MDLNLKCVWDRMTWKIYVLEIFLICCVYNKYLWNVLWVIHNCSLSNPFCCIRFVCTCQLWSVRKLRPPNYWPRRCKRPSKGSIKMSFHLFSAPFLISFLTFRRYFSFSLPPYNVFVSFSGKINSNFPHILHFFVYKKLFFLTKLDFSFSFFFCYYNLCWGVKQRPRFLINISPVNAPETEPI